MLLDGRLLSANDSVLLNRKEIEFTRSRETNDQTRPLMKLLFPSNL